MTAIHQVKSEFLDLIEIYKHLAPEMVLEIGAGSGGSLKHFILNAPPHTQFISLDNGRADLTHLYKHLKGSQTLVLLREDSHSPVTAQEVARQLGEINLDFLFIDGNHSYEGVKKDFLMYSPFVKNGIVVLHDIVKHPSKFNCHVDILWNDLKGCYTTYEIIEDKKQGWGGIGIIPKGKDILRYMELLYQMEGLNLYRTPFEEPF